ncbi:MFS transporter [Cuniculiplasma sp. SKW3]|uniref:MFS transporter n=1 Tax=unclassified Cuniculiplasma TaxID=2619706 RepID=UPI003FD3CCD9
MWKTQGGLPFLKNSDKYYASAALFFFASGLYGIFINIFFFVTQSLESVILYQTTFQISQTLFFILGTYAMRIISAKYLYATGNILRAITLILLYLIPFLSTDAMFFGFIFGISSGLFWGGNATFSLEISRSTNRYTFLSINSAVSSLAALLSPAIGGFLISESTFSGLNRYIFDFSLSSILLILSSLVSLFISQKGEIGGTFHIKETIIKEEEYKDYRLFFFFSSILGTVISTLMPIYIYYVTKNYIITGIYGSLASATGFISNVVAPKLMVRMKQHTVKIVIILIFWSFLFLFKGRFITEIVFGGSFLILFFLTPISNLGMGEFMRYLDQFKKTRHFWINREYYLVSGRILSFFSILLIVDSMSIYDSLSMMPVFSLSLLGLIPVLKKVKT